MARPREFDLDTATDNLMNAFWKAGYEATSLSDLMAATGLKKGSLYAAFGDKRAMYLRGLAAYDAQYVDAAVEMMANLVGRAALEAFLDLPAKSAEAQDRRGCYLCNASMDADALDKASRLLANTSREKLISAIQTSLTQANERGTPIDDIAAHADRILALYFGLRTLARSGVPVDRLHAAAKAEIARL